MATLWIREYSTVPAALGGASLQVAQEPGVDQTPLSFTTTQQSAAFAADTKYIEIYGSAAFHYVIGANPSATTGAMKVPVDTPKFFGVAAGQKIAAVLAA